MAKHDVLLVKTVDFGAGGLKQVKAPKMSFRVQIDADKKLIAALDKDPLLMADLNDAAKKVYDQFTKSMKTKLASFDKLFVDLIDAGEKKETIEKNVAGLRKSIADEVAVVEKGAELAVMAAYKKLQGKHKEWKKFKIKVAASITGTVAGLITSVTLMAVGGVTGGAGAVIGAAGLIKSAQTLTKDINKIGTDIDSAVKEMEKIITFVEKTAEKKRVFVANEASAAVLQEFLGMSQPSFKMLSNQGELVAAKQAELVVGVHDVAKTLNATLKAQDKFKKEFLSDVGKKLKKHPTTRKKENFAKVQRQLDDALAGNYTLVQKMLDKVIAMNADAKKWDKEVKRLQAIVGKLGKMDTKGLKVLREALKLLGAGLSVIDGNRIVTTSAELTTALVPAGVFYAYDKISSKALDGTVFDAA